MRPFTICYALMTVSLGSLVVYGVANAEELRNPFGDARVYLTDGPSESQPTIILPPATDTSAAKADVVANASAETSVAPLIPVLSPGMTGDEVIALIGDPQRVSADGSRWTYGSSVLIFNDDALAGHIAFDPVQAALNKYNHMMASIAPKADAERETKSSVSGGPKILTAKTAKRFKNYGDKYAYRPVAAGSARNGYRYDANQNEYSYYMNRMGPANRLFTRQTALPRGMMTATDRSMGGYRSTGSSGYDNRNAQYFRR